MFETIINYIDGTKESSKLNINVSGEVTTATLAVKELDYKKIASIDVLLNEDEINAGDGGFFLVPANNRLQDSAIGHFKDHDDLELELLYPKMTVLGINHNNKAYIVFATGMKEIAWHYIKIKDNKYYFYMRFAVRGEELYEDIALRVHTLSGDLSYSAMARSYRGYLLDNGYKTIKERLHPALAYATDTMYVRIRMGWKPVPCTVLEQTEETEPEMHVACTFSDVENLMHEYKKAGIDKAEFCLVGFNKSGHDGRWPQIFPIEERLGGEEGLKKLIKTAHSLGYTVCCHTNSTDGYTIANNLADSDIARKNNGEKSVNCEYWSGGRMYNICPKRGYEISEETLPPLAKLGFSGTHYIDVITATPPRNCYHKEHKVNYKEGVEWFDKLFILSRRLFGCIGSECSFTHNYKYLDYVLYDTFRKCLKHERQADEPDFVDEFVPFLQLVFHGIVLSNPQASTVNAGLSSDPAAMLKVIEYGGRPAIYYYSKFVSNGKDWMGDIDFRMSNPEEVEEGVRAAKKMYDVYEELSFLQYELMESHEKLSEGVYKTVYSDGSTVTVDYNKNTYTLEK